jgi:chromate transport protein ChrA
VIYCGYVRFGVIGGLAVAVALALPPFIIVGTSYLLGVQAIGDWLTAVIAIISLIVITIRKKVPEPAVIGAAGVVGMVAYQMMR